MAEFDLDALERVLSKKGRAPRQDLSSLDTKSKQELYAEAKRLADDLHSVYDRYLQTRYKGDSYSIRFNSLFHSGYREDIEEVSKAVLGRLVANGRRHLKDYYDMINQVVMQNPEMALEANLEGKTGKDVLVFVYSKRLNKIKQLLADRVSSEAGIYLDFDITMKPPLGEEFNIGIRWWSNRSNISLDGVTINPRHAKDMVKLVHFLTYFEQVTNEVNRQLDAVKIRKEVKR